MSVFCNNQEWFCSEEYTEESGPYPNVHYMQRRLQDIQPCRGYYRFYIDDAGILRPEYHPED